MWRGPVKRNNNFTLIELLVVVAIMAVCTSQIRQLSMGQLLYCESYNGYFPDTEGENYSRHNWGWAGNSDRWGSYEAIHRPVNPFITSNLSNDVKMKFLECPSDENPAAYDKYGEGKYSWYKVYGTSYSINKGPQGNCLGNRGEDAPQQLLQVKEPSRMVMGLENHAVKVFQGLPESDDRDWNINKAHNIGNKKFTNLMRVNLSALINKRIYRREERGNNWFDESFTTENNR